MVSKGGASGVRARCVEVIAGHPTHTHTHTPTHTRATHRRTYLPDGAAAEGGLVGQVRAVVVAEHAQVHDLRVEGHARAVEVLPVQVRDGLLLLMVVWFA
jgi:hypothetical protein